MGVLKHFSQQKRLPYPTGHTIGFFNNAIDARHFMRDLYQQGLSSEDVNLLAGKTGLHMIDLDGTQHAFFDRWVRLSQKFWGSGEWFAFQKADEELRKGHYLITVLTHESPLKKIVVKLMKKYNAHDIKYFDPSFVEELQEKNLIT